MLAILPTIKFPAQNRTDKNKKIYAKLSFEDTYLNLKELYGFKSKFVFTLAIISDIIFPDMAPKVHPK